MVRAKTRIYAIAAGGAVLLALGLLVALRSSLLRQGNVRTVNPDVAPLSQLRCRILVPHRADSLRQGMLLGLISGLAVDRGGNIYVSDFRGHRVTKYDSTGRFLQHIGRPGQGPGELLKPTGLCLDRQGFVYVLNSGNSRVEVYDPDGSYYTSFRAPSSALTGTPGRAVAARDGGEVFLNDPLSGHLVTVFSIDGRKLRELGAVQRYPTQFEQLVFNQVVMRLDQENNILHVVFPKLCEYRQYTVQGQLLLSRRILSPEMQARYEEQRRRHSKRRRGERAIRWADLFRDAAVLPDHSLLLLAPTREYLLCQISLVGLPVGRFSLVVKEPVIPAYIAALSLQRIVFADRVQCKLGLLQWKGDGK